MVVTRTPKVRHYAGTSAIKLRVAAAVCCKNIGAEHLDVLFKSNSMSPSKNEFLKRLEKSRNEVKKRRLQFKMKNDWRESTSAKQEGLTYVSGMGSTFERAAEAASCLPAWSPPVVALEPCCALVVVDIETAGLKMSAEILQIAAKCNECEFSAYILPRNEICERSSAVTGLCKEGNQLLLHNTPVTTTPAAEVAQQFMNFLRQMSSQCILVGHNIRVFDAPRILHFLSQHHLDKDFCQLVYGFVDTLTIILQGKTKKLESLAKMFLTSDDWAPIVNSAHDGLSDCVLLHGLIKHFQVSDTELKEKVIKMQEFLERQTQLMKKKENIPNLQKLTEFGISKFMINRMAENGVTLEELQLEYENEGRAGLVVCVGMQLGGKPRVTRSKKIIDCIENYLQSH